MSVLGGPAAAVSSSSTSYAAIGGGATPFNPSWDLSTLLQSGSLINTCMKHVQRTKRRQSRELFNDAPDFAHYEGTNRLGKLYCRTGFHMQIYPNGKVNGTRQDNSRFGVLEFLSVAFGLVSIKGKESNRYLCMNQGGKLYGSLNHTTDCIFMERMLENYYNTYTSCKYSKRNRKWFVALNKRGRPRKGSRSKKKQKFSQFLVLHLDDDDVKQKRRNFFKSTQLGISSFTSKWRNSMQVQQQQNPTAQQQSRLTRVWTGRRPLLGYGSSSTHSNSNVNNNNGQSSSSNNRRRAGRRGEEG